MHDPTRFGDFLLLKKLGEDPLGETYRAGRISGTSVGELVFLRTFNVPRGRSAELVAKLREATPRFEGAGLTYHAESGDVSGVAYAVYPYVTGWDIPQFIKKATAGFSELELDHGLLIAERLAMGLAVVHQADSAHGFLVPQQVRLTSEGEIDLLGLESGSYLARLVAAGGMEELHPYLSPEVRAGQAPTPPDDVYSLGALLWKLLTGQEPPLDPAGVTTALATARSVSGEMLPPGLVELLQSSLTASRDRLAQATLWHNQLTEWMGHNDVRTTHFDLAFFIHELFRLPIQSDQEEIEKEKKLNLVPKVAAPPPPVSPPPVSPPPVSPPPPAPELVPEEPEMSDVILRPDLSGMVQRPTARALQADPKETPVPVSGTGRSKAPLIGGLAALLVLGAVGIWFALQRGGASSAPVTPPAAVAEAPSADLQIAQLELERLVKEQSAVMNDQLSEEYEENIRSLREQVEAAQAAESAALRAIKAPPRAAPPRAASPEVAPPSPAAPETSGAETSVNPPQSTSSSVAMPDTTASDTTAPDTTASDTTAPDTTVSDTTAPDTTTSDTTTPDATAPDTTASDPGTPDTTAASATGASDAAPIESGAPPPKTSPPEPEVDSAPVPPAQVASPPKAASVTPPLRQRMPEPRFPARARQQRKEATVLIKVLVDKRGNVLDAQPVVDKGDPYGFYQEAIRAARAATFTPAKSDGVPIEMWTTVVITFKLK